MKTPSIPPPPRRRGRIAKLPKMNNSERGKYYRQKYKEHETGLERSVATLRRQVRDLELFLHVKHELAFRNPVDDCEAAVARIFKYFESARDSGVGFTSSFSGSLSDVITASCAKKASSYEWNTTHAFLYFDLESFVLEGCVDAPVIAMHGMLHTKYTQATVESMFPHLHRDSGLLDVLLEREVQYPCTYHFYFGSGGVLHNKIVEADYVYGLQQVLGSLEDVEWLLEGSHRCRQRQDSFDDIIRGPPSMALNFILS